MDLGIRSIPDVAGELGLHPDDVLLYGRGKAKVDLAAAMARPKQGKGRLVLVSAINPTPAGEGKTTVSIGLAMGLLRPLPVETPLAGLSKADVIRRGRELRLDLTFSCLAPGPDHRHCGRCNKCAERMRGFAAADVEDPTEYAPPPGRGDDRGPAMEPERALESKGG